jgi:hypothetical protein
MEQHRFRCRHRRLNRRRAPLHLQVYAIHTDAIEPECAAPDSAAVVHHRALPPAAGSDQGSRAKWATASFGGAQHPRCRGHEKPGWYGHLRAGG